MATVQMEEKQTLSQKQRASTWQFMLILGLINCGSTAVDAMSNFVISITLKHFIYDVQWITWILATNRLFGFLVQPYVAWKGDHIFTRFGRRRLFMLIGMPLTLITMLIIGSMPYIFRTDALRHASFVFWIMLVVNVAMQFFQDVNAGSQDPLYADTFQHKDLGRAAGIRNYWQLIAGLSVSYIGMRLMSKCEFYPYLITGAWMVVSIYVTVTVVREKPPQSVSITRYNPIEHLGLLFKNTDYLRVAVISALWLVTNACFFALLSLFVTRSLGLEMGDLAMMTLVGAAAAFLFSHPAGYFTDRFGPKPVILVGFLMLAAISAYMAYSPIGYWALFTIMIIFSISSVLLLVPMTPIVFQYAAPSERGKIFGLVQFVRAFSAFIFVLLIGYLVGHAPSYDPMAIYGEDIKDTHQLAMQIHDHQTPLTQLIYENLTPEFRNQLLTDSQEQLTTPGAQTGSVNPRYAEFKKTLASELTRIAHDKIQFQASDFKGVALTQQSQHFLSQAPKNAEEKYVFNRSLIQDSFPQLLQPKQDYRVAYKLCMELSILACVLTFTARKGKYAEAVGEDDQIYDL